MTRTTSSFDVVGGSGYELAYASPRLFPTTFSDPVFAQAGTLGPDGRRRRAFHCISDPDISPVYPNGFVNEDLRAGGPHLCKLPMDIEFLRPSHPFYEPLCTPGSSVIQRIQEILAEWKVAYTDIHAMLQTWKFQRSLGGVPTLVISATRGRDGVDKTWMFCARHIQEYLVTVLPRLQDQGQDPDEGEDKPRTQPLPHVIRVEIAGPSVFMGDALHLVDKCDAIFSIWNEVCQAVTGKINLVDVVTIGCYRLGDSDDAFECAPTISVGVKHD